MIFLDSKMDAKLCSLGHDKVEKHCTTWEINYIILSIRVEMSSQVEDQLALKITAEMSSVLFFSNPEFYEKVKLGDLLKKLCT